MNESVKDLVVRLSFQHGDTKSQIAAIKNEIKLLDSGFRAAAATAGGFSDGLNEAGARSNLLRQQIALQEQAVQRYGQAMDKARASIQAAQDRQADYTAKLAAAKQKHAELTSEIDRVKAAMKASKAATGENTDEYINLMIELEELQGHLKENNDQIKQWESGLKKCDTTIANADKNLQRLTIAQNESKAAMGAMQRELDGLNTKLDQKKKKLLETSEVLQKYSDRLKSNTQWQAQAGRELSKASAGIVAAGVAAAGAAIGWESDFAGVQKTVSGTAQQLAEIEDQLIGMSKVKPVDSKVLAGIAADAGQLGVSTGSIAAFTDAMADLSATTNLTAENGASQFAKFKNITNMQESQYRNLGSAVVELGNNMATTEADIMNMAMNLGAAGAQIHMSQADILGISAALSSMGLEAQAGGTAFSKTFVNMQVAVETGSDALKDYAEVAGMTAQQFADLFRADAAQAVTAFVEGLSKGSQSAIVMLTEMGITETRMRDALLRSTNAAGLFSNAIQMANRAWTENIALTNEANVRYGTTASKLTMAGNKAKAAAAKFGKDLIPIISDGIDWVGDLLEKFNALDEEQRKNILTWGAFIAAIGPGISIIGKANAGIAGFAGGLGKFTASMAQAGGGLSGFMSAIGGLLGPVGIAGLAIASGVMIYKFADWASGARAAREATKALNDEAKEWKDTQAQTMYDTGNADPLARFGLSADAFKGGTKAAQEWISELMAVWTDGKNETADIVRQFADGFSGASDGVRDAINGQRELLEGYEALTPEARAQIDADIEQLDAWDKEVAALLKKRQNGMLTAEEQARLNEIVQQRTEIEIRYKLEDGSGYDQIITQLHAEMERAAAEGGTMDATIWGDTMNALAEGRKAYNATLEESYNAEYARIQAIEDETAKVNALAALNEQYNAQRAQGEAEYNAAVREAGTEAWNAGAYDEQIAQLDALAGKMGDLNNLDIPDIAEFAKGIDEGKMASMISMIEQLKASGMSDGELADLGIDFDDIMQKIEAIKAAAESTKGLEGIGEMFGTALPEEIQRIMVGLDMTQAAADWAAFASGESLTAIKADAEIAEIQASAIPIKGLITVDGELGSVTGADGVTYKVTGATVNADGTLATVTCEDGKTYTVTDGDILADGTLATVTGEDGKKYAVDGVLASVDGELGSVIGADGKEYKVIGATVGVDGTLTSVIAEDGRVYTVPNVQTDITAKASIVLNPLDQAAISAWERLNQGAEITGPRAKVGVALGADWAKDLQAAYDGGILEVFGADGARLTVTPEVLEKIDANDVAMVDEDGRMRIIIVPELGSTEGVEMTGAAMAQNRAEGIPIIEGWSSSTEQDVQRINNISAALAELRSSANGMRESGEFADEFGNTLAEVDAAAQEAENSVRQAFDGLDEIDIENLANQAAMLMAALEGGDLDENTAAEYAAQMQQILDLVSASDQYLGAGNNISAGIAQGMNAYGWTGDAGTLASAIQTSINAALGAHSPATALIPTGGYVSAGIAQGMTAYSFADAAASVAGSIAGGFNGLPAQGYTIGANFGQGLYNGLRSKMSASLALARQYANQITNAFKGAWREHSPSRVAEELTWNFGRGLERGMADWPTVSERMLDEDIAALHGGMNRAVQRVDSRQQTYNQQQSVRVEVREMNVRDESDIEDIAYGVAGLMRSRQRGYGY